ncbi:nuclear transport factor 2 family protein [Rhizorhabdus histidinilytica]|nr:nuclear transport factor 2 family protein [Rhizorhabdus histidinilytica]
MMAYTLQQLSDLEDIRTVKHRYFRGIDTADEPLLETLFADDVSVEYRGGGYKVALTGKAEMLDFLMNSFNASAVAMHHGHMPDIRLTGDDEAEGIWYLEDIFISLDRRDVTTGTAIYRDRYRRIDGTWKIARTEYDRIMEVVQPLTDAMAITVHHLGKVGRKPEDCGDVSHLITWFDRAA